MTIAPGASSTLSWTSSASATGCTASGGAPFDGTQPANGSVTVSPAAMTNYVLSCTFGSGPIAGTATVTVASSQPPGGAARAFANPSDGKISYRECALALAVITPYAIPAGRPRYCVFDVAGAIILQSPARITIPKIYIAGQPSPGGIEFRLGANYNPVDSLIDTRRGGDHMILRHVRVRLGEHPGRISDNGDAIRLLATSFQIIDHVPSMFGTDESLDTAC